jgi:hypothetical protein
MYIEKLNPSCRKGLVAFIFTLSLYGILIKNVPATDHKNR